MQAKILVAGAAIVCSLIAQSNAAAFELCGLGVPPGSPGFAQFEVQKAAEVQRYGFLRVCETNLARYDVVAQIKPLDKVLPKLAFRPVDLARSPFAQFQLMGGMAEPVSNTVSRVYRVFRMRDGHVVTLFEHDMSADGARMFRAPKDEPYRINGLPANLMVFQAGSGRAVSALSWKEGRRYYEIWIDANVALEHRRAQLFALAESIPKAVPACPNEPEPESVTIGPDGVPHWPPPPQTMTVEQAEALSQKIRRPGDCK